MFTVFTIFMVDAVLINPGASRATYQGLAEDLSAI